MSLNICLCAHKQGFIIIRRVISKVNVLSRSYYCRQRVFACAQRRSMEKGKKTQHVSMLEKISFPHMPGPQPASCSLKKRAFPALCPLGLHWGFSNRVTAFLSHVLAAQSAGTSHQSAVRDGSSGIILTVGPASMRLDGVLQTDTRIPLSSEILFFN